MTYRELFYMYPTETWKQYLEYYKNLTKEGKDEKKKLVIVAYSLIAMIASTVLTLFDRSPDAPEWPEIKTLLDKPLGERECV